MRRLFEGSVYSGAALIRVNTVCAVFYSMGGGGGASPTAPWSLFKTVTFYLLLVTSLADALTGRKEKIQLDKN